MIYFVMVLSAASVSLIVLAIANFAPSRPAAVDRRIASLQISATYFFSFCIINPPFQNIRLHRFRGFFHDHYFLNIFYTINVRLS